MPTMTVAEQRQQAKQKYDAFMEKCPSRQVLGRVGTKWAALIIAALADGPKRHSELARIIAGVSQKMLTQTLRELERDGLISRTITPSVPVRVDYTVTDLGASLQPLLAAVKSWAEQNMDRVNEARAQYDASVTDLS
jgi:DNA-binding HxlR family transcriptional regulator